MEDTAGTNRSPLTQTLADSVSNELNMINNELVKAKRLLDENTVDRDTADKRKKNLDIEVRHLVALKAQKYKEIRNLQVCSANLTFLNFRFCALSFSSAVTSLTLKPMCISLSVSNSSLDHSHLFGVEVKRVR